MTKRYVTFGQSHEHIIDGETIDRDCVVIIEGSREDVFNLFGPKFCFEYTEEEWDEDRQLPYYPRGYVDLTK